MYICNVITNKNYIYIMNTLHIAPYKYEVIAYDGNEYLGKHLSTSTTRYEAKKNMFEYLRNRGYRMNEVKIKTKALKTV